MSDEIFQPGGPLNARRIGPDKYIFSISFPRGEDGRIARSCPEAGCSPGYFKVKPGTGVAEGQTVAYCPYCRCEREPDEFTTEEQKAYAQSLVAREARKGITRALRGAMGMGHSGERTFDGGLISIKMTLKESPLPHVSRPFEELLQRCVICPHCGLDHSVFGLAVWCQDCGKDIFLTHVRGELEVIERMLGDVERRRNVLGTRVAARDLENCLEDLVSVYEAVLRALFTRNLQGKKVPTVEIEGALKKIGNRFQNVRLSTEIYEQQLGIQLFANLGEVQVSCLRETFEKRHPITHNLGVVDRKYLERIQSAEREGREIMVSEVEIRHAIATILVVIESAHQRMFLSPLA